MRPAFEPATLKTPWELQILSWTRYADLKNFKVSIISHLWGVQKGETAIGSATTGSSEAIHLGGLAMKRRWQEKRDADGKDKTKPNIVSYLF